MCKLSTARRGQSQSVSSSAGQSLKLLLLQLLVTFFSLGLSKTLSDLPCCLFLYYVSGRIRLLEELKQAPGTSAQRSH